MLSLMCYEVRQINYFTKLQTGNNVFLFVEICPQICDTSTRVLRFALVSES